MKAKESKDLSEEKLCGSLRLVNLLELKLLEVEREREDSRAIENCYKLKLKRLFDQALAFLLMCFFIFIFIFIFHRLSDHETDKFSKVLCALLFI